MRKGRGRAEACCHLISPEPGRPVWGGIPDRSGRASSHLRTAATKEGVCPALCLWGGGEVTSPQPWWAVFSAGLRLVVCLSSLGLFL